MRPNELRPGMLVTSDMTSGAFVLVISVEGPRPSDRVLLLRSNGGLGLIPCTVGSIASLLVKL